MTAATPAGPAGSPRTTNGVAVVAGGSRGLGLLMAKRLAERGYLPLSLARDGAELERAVATMRGWGHRLEVRTTDVRDADAMARVVAEAERELGPVEVAIHVAGVIQVGPAESMTRDHYQRAIDTMLWGPINLALAVLPAMRSRRRGRIGIVSSVGGAVSVPHLLPYSTAKFGAAGFAEGLAAELAGSGVTATALLPGLMRTGSHVQAEFTGDAAKEYAWFAPGASLPLLSMDGERAAARLVDGVLAGRPVVSLTPLAQVGMRVKGLMPATTVRVMGLVARAMPGPGGTPAGETVQGHDARARLQGTASQVVEALTVLGSKASARYNEMHRGRGSASPA